MTFEEQEALVERARRARAEVIASVITSGARALWLHAVSVHRAWAASQTRNELRKLSDRTLKDIGISRAQIDSLFR
jgi:uncharacterized protein YjiS (DUF1127 family)